MFYCQHDELPSHAHEATNVVHDFQYENSEINSERLCEKCIPSSIYHSYAKSDPRVSLCEAKNLVLPTWTLNAGVEIYYYLKSQFVELAIRKKDKDTGFSNVTRQFEAMASYSRAKRTPR